MTLPDYWLHQSLNKEKDTAFKAVSKIRNHEFRLHDY